MLKKKLAALLLAIVCSTTIVGCKKTDDSNNPNNGESEISDNSNNESENTDESPKKELQTLKTKEEVENFSREALSKVQEILTNNNIESTLTSDGLKLYYDGSYEKLGKNYDVKFEGKFDTFFDTTEECDIQFTYRIPISSSADILSLNLPHINALMDIMLLDDNINSKYSSRDELLKQLELEFKGETSSDDIFSFSRSNIKDEAECSILEGTVYLGTAIVEGGLVGDATMYEFDTWDEYDTLPAKANQQVFDTMQTLGLIGSDEVYEGEKDEPLLKYVNGTPLPDEEAYLVGMVKDYSDSFGIEYILQGICVPYDAATNTITSTKYVDTFIKLLNTSEYYMNKFDKDELMSAIYERSKVILDNADTYLPVTIDGVENIEVGLNYEQTQLSFKVTFLSPATVEGQTSR